MLHRTPAAHSRGFPPGRPDPTAHFRPQNAGSALLPHRSHRNGGQGSLLGIGLCHPSARLRPACPASTGSAKVRLLSSSRSSSVEIRPLATGPRGWPGCLASTEWARRGRQSLSHQWPPPRPVAHQFRSWRRAGVVSWDASTRCLCALSWALHAQTWPLTPATGTGAASSGSSPLKPRHPAGGRGDGGGLRGLQLPGADGTVTSGVRGEHCRGVEASREAGSSYCPCRLRQRVVRSLAQVRWPRGGPGQCDREAQGSRGAEGWACAPSPRDEHALDSRPPCGLHLAGCAPCLRAVPLLSCGLPPPPCPGSAL